MTTQPHHLTLEAIARLILTRWQNGEPLEERHFATLSYALSEPEQPEPTKDTRTAHERFWRLLDAMPELIQNYWDRETRELRVESVKLANGYLGAHERTVLAALVDIWNNREDHKVSVNDLADLPPRLKEPLIKWLAEPFWP